MKSLYADFNDVDLSVGGIFEKKIPGTLAGPVFHCIYVKQFYNTRVGDRYVNYLTFTIIFFLTKIFSGLKLVTLILPFPQINCLK